MRGQDVHLTGGHPENHYPSGVFTPHDLGNVVDKTFDILVICQFVFWSVVTRFRH